MDRRDLLTAAQRSELVALHLELSRRIASAIHERCRQHVELDELVSLGNLGLAEAATRFDPTAGVRFRTFASARVHGAIIDGLRRMCPLPHRTWKRLNELRAEDLELEQLSARASSSSDEEFADQTKRRAAVREEIDSLRRVLMTSLDYLPANELPCVEPGTVERLHWARLRGWLALAVAELPRKERHIVRRHYWDHRDLMEAGAEIGVTKSGASRMHARALAALRSQAETSHLGHRATPSP